MAATGRVVALMRMHTHIYLVGLMGAGKTTVGRRLARLLSRQFIDTDQALEERTGVSVSHIFEIEGERGFREREARLLAEVSRAPDRGGRGAVIATGGGIVLRESNRRLMRRGLVVYLRASLELLCERLQGCQTRPLLSAPDPKSKIAQLLEERDPLYTADARLIVDVGGGPAAATANRIYDLLQRNEQGENSQH